MAIAIPRAIAVPLVVAMVTLPSPGKHEVRVRIVGGSEKVGPESFVQLEMPLQTQSPSND